MSIANNLETLRYFKSKLVFLAEIAHKMNHCDCAFNYCQQALELCQELGITLVKDCEELLGQIQGNLGDSDNNLK
ncbi:hypothetical protein [Microcystis sp.]|jgi:hypothetical protein|uniref:hypothetical protein n=1 Tax=Microcystis sp. TaxID=1127 RepID=UPI00391BB12A